MAVFRCKTCGGQLNVTAGQTVCTCEYCGNVQTLPKNCDENIANLFNRANELRINCDFDRAQNAYEKIVENVPYEAEAYWGIVLCKFGVEYVDDPVSHNRIPTCHRTQVESIQADFDYKAAIRYADSQQREIYEAEALTIDNIQKKILAIVQNEKPYDVFICYKETDENGNRTEDSSIANEIYQQLTKEGLRVFFAAVTLQGKVGEYESYIFNALESSKVMLVIGTKPEYFEAVWVRNEWGRFLKLRQNDPSKILIPCYKNMSVSEIPVEFARLQAMDISSLSFLNNLISAINDLIKKTTPQSYTQERSAPVNPQQSTAFQEQPQQNLSKTDHLPKHETYRSEKNKPSCLGLFIKVLLASVIIYLVLSTIVSVASKNKKEAEVTDTVTTTEIITEPAVKFGEEVVELHDVTPTEQHHVTESASYGYVLNNVLWDGAFVYRAGNGDSFAYSVYQTDGMFEKITFKATPLLGQGDFHKNSTVDIMLVNNETNDIIFTQTIDYYSENVEIEADITGINYLKIYVNKTSTGLGNLGYTLIKDAYLYPVGYSEENAQEDASAVS